MAHQYYVDVRTSIIRNRPRNQAESDAAAILVVLGRVGGDILYLWQVKMGSL
jgi:hypothetical protein